MTNQKQPRIVVIGGGTGLPILLRGLKQYPVHLTAIVTVADDGGSSGKLRQDLQIPAPGDIRNVMMALSEVDPFIQELFQHRFHAASELSGHSLGNLIIAATTSIKGDFVEAIQEMSKVLKVTGQVLPAANQSVVLHAEMADGSIISGESQIPLYGSRIKRVFLTPETIQPLPETIDAIRNADLIIIGPGSLYTSILPNLLIPGLGEEVCRASAKKIYICNLMTQAGETTDFTASDHVQAIYHHMNEEFLHTVLVNSGEIPLNIQALYEEEYAKPVICDVDNLRALGLHVMEDKIITFENNLIRHDTEAVAKIFYSMLAEGSSDLAQS